ncbi:MAG: oligopeptide/dipeptide ABC transporter ATP-binding protein [Bacillota bacterium]
MKNPYHPYTHGLMKSIPQLNGNRLERLHTISGSVPPLENVPPGCRFASRCKYASGLCLESDPKLKELENGRKVRCWRIEEIAEVEGGLLP